MMHPGRSLRLLPLALAAAVAAPLAAQSLTLDRVGGALGGTLTLPLQGQPNEAYVVVLDIVEQSTLIPSLGVTLDITDQLAWLSYSVPSFVGVTNGTGSATPTVGIPNDPFFSSLVFRFQAIAGNNPYRASNLVRLTAQAPGTFVPALNQPSVPILGGGTAVAPNNELLFIGGSGPVAQRYRNRTEDWELAGASFGVGLLGQTTGLADGRVLFTGGVDLTGQATNAAAIYDPVTQTTTTLTMNFARAGHGASLMGNGRVLVTGGLQAFDLANPLTLLTGIQVTSEIFDPVTNTFTAGPNMLEARALHTSTTLTNGQVLIAGGISLLPIVSIPTVSATAYRFNPTTNSFGLPAFFSGARFLHTAAPLSNGRVLLVGGLTLDFTAFLTSGQITDLVIGTRTDCQMFQTGAFGFGTFTTANGMQVGRAGAAVAPLPNGGALIAGGFQLTLDIPNSTFVANATDPADVFRQSPLGFTPTGSMAAPRLFPTTVNLPDGTIMVVGGGPTDAEIYQR
ncbi:MAG: Kelch repeat-containing protein [Planctomycetota bacterium]